MRSVVDLDAPALLDRLAEIEQQRGFSIRALADVIAQAIAAGFNAVDARIDLKLSTKTGEPAVVEASDIIHRRVGFRARFVREGIDCVGVLKAGAGGQSRGNGGRHLRADGLDHAIVSQREPVGLGFSAADRRRFSRDHVPARAHPLNQLHALAGEPLLSGGGHRATDDRDFSGRLGLVVA